MQDSRADCNRANMRTAGVPAGSYEQHCRYISKSWTAQTGGCSGLARAELDFLSLANRPVQRAGTDAGGTNTKTKKPLQTARAVRSG